MNGRTNSNNTVESELVQLPLDPPSNVNEEPYSGRVELTWTDAKDKYATPEGEVAASPQLMAAKWDRTVVVRKPDTDPSTLSDGTTIISSDVRNQYQSVPYVDTSVVDGTEYHYGLFSVTDTNILSAPAIIIATPKSGTLLREVPNNTVITITENGVPAEFVVATHDYEATRNGTGRVLLLRCNHVTEDGTITQNLNTPFENGTYCEYLNSTYKNKLSSIVQSWIGTTKFECTRYSTATDASYTSRYEVEKSVFAISAVELDDTADTPSGNPPNRYPGMSPEGIYIDGLFDFLKGNYSRRGTDHGSLTRSFVKRFYANQSTSPASAVTYSYAINGDALYILSNQNAYPWPCFTLPDTCRINENNILIEE